jgi:hypothetical protein
MEHLLNQCSFSVEIWDQVSQIMRKTNRARDNIISTIENWGSTTFNNPILNRIWQLLLGFVVWKIWKERNREFFTPSPHYLPLSGLRSMAAYMKQSELNNGPRKISHATPGKASFSLNGS